MQFMGQGKGDEIPHLMWSWVFPLKEQDEMNAEQKLNVN